MIKLFVFDTNSLISAAILPSSINGRSFRHAIQNDILLISEKTLEEFNAVLFREKFDKYLPNLSDRSTFIERLMESSIRVEPDISITECRDPKDDKFLELAVAANASCIITGDSDLLVLHPFRGIPILKASDFLKRF